MTNININNDYDSKKCDSIFKSKHNDLFGILRSLPARKDESGCTMCALTARLNGRLFGVVLPMGNAFSALEHPGLTCTGTLPKGKENKLPDNSWQPIRYNEFIEAGKAADISDMAVSEISEDSNLIFDGLGVELIADIAVSSDSEMGKIFGHRVLAYKMFGEWFVLDPYVKGNKGEGIKLNEYMKTHNILKCNFYESSGFNFQKYKKQKENGARELPKRGINEQHKLNTYINQQDDRKTLLLLFRMNNGESLDNDDRLQLMDDNESDALALGILNSKDEQKNVLNMLFDWIRKSGKRRKKKSVFINMYRILCTENKNLCDDNINNAIINHIKNTSNLNYLDTDTCYWLYKAFKDEFDEKKCKELEIKYKVIKTEAEEQNGRMLYVRGFHEYYISSSDNYEINLSYDRFS